MRKFSKKSDIPFIRMSQDKQNQKLGLKNVNRRTNVLPSLILPFQNNRTQQKHASLPRQLSNRKTQQFSYQLIQFMNNFNKKTKSSLRMKNSGQKILQTQRNMRKIINKENQFSMIKNHQNNRNKPYKQINSQSQQQDNFNLNLDLCFRNNGFPMFKIQVLSNFCYDSNFPIMRIGSCLVLTHDGTLFLIGGAVRRKLYHISQNQKYKDTLIHRYKDKSWVQQIIKNTGVQFSNFIGHTVQKFGSKSLVIIGGLNGDSGKANNYYQCSLKLYNYEKQEIREHYWNVRLKWHASSSISNYIIIHGGINNQKQCCSELIILKMADDEKSLERITVFTTNQKLVNHKIVLTVGRLVKFPKKKIANIEGIILFGGQNSQRKMNNQLKIIKTKSLSHYFPERKNYNLKFQNLELLGTAPQPRVHHSLNFLCSKLFIIIIGGLNSYGNFLNDIWIADLLKMQWIQTKTHPRIEETFGGIAKHSAVETQNGQSIFIFGGAHQIDKGLNNFWKFQLKYNYEQISKQKRSQKQVSSFWSISYSKIQIDECNAYE